MKHFLFDPNNPKHVKRWNAAARAWVRRAPTLFANIDVCPHNDSPFRFLDWYILTEYDDGGEPARTSAPCGDFAELLILWHEKTLKWEDE